MTFRAMDKWRLVNAENAETVDCALCIVPMSDVESCTLHRAIGDRETSYGSQAICRMKCAQADVKSTQSQQIRFFT